MTDAACFPQKTDGQAAGESFLKKSQKIIRAIAAAAVIVFLIAACRLTSAESVQGTFWSLTPPLIAIVLALATKEVYSSLFLGIVTGALLFSGFSFETTTKHLAHIRHSSASTKS